MGKKILLADDSITIQKVIELTFSDEDFDVVTVGNGRLALEKLAEVRPDIVLCDIIMPEKDGYEVCEQIKKSATFSHVPVLLLTGAFEPFDQERAARAGYDGSLAKPFEPETLIAKVRDLLARAPQRAAAPPPPPVVPFARPTALVPPPVIVPPPPPPAPPRPVAAAPVAEAPAFIPDEPFDAVPSAPQAPPPPPPPLAPMSEEESATLMAAPSALTAPHPVAAPEPESTSTVMFKASDLPWNMPPSTAPAPPTPTPVPPMAAAASPTPAGVEPAFVPEPESSFEPEAIDAAEVIEEAAVFEEVVEEDLDFEPVPSAHVDEGHSADSGATLMFSGTSTLPPQVPQSSAETSSATTASFGAVEETTFSETDFEPEPMPEPEPEPEVATAPPMPLPVFKPEPPPAPPAPAPRQSFTPPSMPAVRPIEPPPPAPRFEPRPAPDSFADLAPLVAEREPAPPPPSEAAAVSVPVEMVEKIAQRVVAQISEKAVREIAWEVIPDLAEALIKQEIERLKAELQKI